MKLTSRIAIIVLLGLLATTQYSCKKEKFLDGPANLGFSDDTIIFDTVFTTVGSTTKFFRVYNNYDQPVIISKIALANGNSSYFRLNVDGIPGRSFEDVEIPAKDSIFIFVEVTVDPTSQNNPLIITDQIIFENKGITQDVDLVAWGQDAYFYKPPSGSGAYYLPCGLIMANDKPHVFYGFAVVDSGCVLTIPPGTKLHFHPNSGLIVYKGSLDATGAVNNKIVFQGDRLEYSYQEIPGQWQGIHFIQAKNSHMEHCLVKNGFYGIWCDTTFSSSDQLDLVKVEIRNQASLGVYINSGARVFGENSLVKNCGSYALAGTYGGEYAFNHCTFANLWEEGERSTPSVYINNWYEYNSTQIVRPLNVQFDNCIIHGNKEREFQTDLQNAIPPVFTFSNCFIKTDIDLSDVLHYISVSKNIDPLFADPSNGNFQLTISSPCRGAANFTGGIFTDFLDQPRDGQPDVGCYEYQ